MVKGSHHTEETKEKLRKSSTGYEHTEEARRKMSEIKKGRHMRIIDGKVRFVYDEK